MNQYLSGLTCQCPGAENREMCLIVSCLRTEKGRRDHAAPCIALQGYSLKIMRNLQAHFPMLSKQISVRSFHLIKKKCPIVNEMHKQHRVFVKPALFPLFTLFSVTIWVSLITICGTVSWYCKLHVYFKQFTCQNRLKGQ